MAFPDDDEAGMRERTSLPLPARTSLPPFQGIPGIGMTDAMLLRSLIAPATRPQATSLRPSPAMSLNLPPPAPEFRKTEFPTPPTPPKKSDWQDAKLPLMAMAMVASAFTRQPAVSAMNAMAAMFKGEREGNREAYQNARANYEDSLQKAAAEQRQELIDYNIAYKNQAMSWRDKLAGMRVTATKRGDKAMLGMLASGEDPGQLLADRAKALEKITPQAVQAARIKKILDANPGMDYFTAEAKAKADAKDELDKAKSGTGQAGDPTLSGDALLKTLDPGTAAEVKALAEYRLPVMNFRSEKMQRLVKLAAQYDPNFDAMQYQIRFGVKKDFTSGKSAQNVTAMNTLIGHMRSLHDEASSLANTKWPTLNRPLNEAARLTGDPRLAQFQSNMLAVAEELGRVFKGTVTEGEVNRWLAAINSSMSPDQLQGALSKITELLGSRVEALGDQFKRGTGSEMELLSPKSKDALEYIKKKGADAKLPPTSVQPGDVMEGYRFKGGDPNAQENWERVQ